MNPNHYLAVAINYLLAHRPGWPAKAVVGKTLVSSSLIDRVVAKAWPHAVRGAGRVQVVYARPVRRILLFWRRREPPAPALRGSTGASGSTDKDGMILALLGRRDNGSNRQGSGRALGQALTHRSLARHTTRGSMPLPTPAQKARLKKLAPADRCANRHWPGDPIAGQAHACLRGTTPQSAALR